MGLDGKHALSAGKKAGLGTMRRASSKAYEITIEVRSSVTKWPTFSWITLSKATA